MNTDKRLHTGLWVTQVLLAVAFGMAGAMKTFTPLAELATKLPWVPDFPAWVPRLAGGSELLAAVGLIAPAATRIAPKLTPAAAAGLVLVMILAIWVHGARGEWGGVAANVVLGAMAAFVVWGRLRAAPIHPKA